MATDTAVTIWGAAPIRAMNSGVRAKIANWGRTVQAKIRIEPADMMTELIMPADSRTEAATPPIAPPTTHRGTAMTPKKPAFKISTRSP
ncbi:hypothetical protein D3C86_1277440 [compost metagenome]